jgi:hypothetical protein
MQKGSQYFISSIRDSKNDESKPTTPIGPNINSIGDLPIKQSSSLPLKDHIKVIDPERVGEEMESK